MEYKEALSGVKVLDFTRVLTGPFVTSFLADHGATVIKVESSAGLDSMRYSAPFKDGIPGVNRAGTFAMFSSNKYSITLNLKSHEGIELAKRLVKWADVLVESYGARTMDKLGLGYDVVYKVNPHIIMLSLSVMGQTGPKASYQGYGFNTMGLAGMAELTGWPDRFPVIPHNAYPDSVAPWFGVISIIAALDYRHRTGKGQYIDVNQYETTLQALTLAILEYTSNGRLITREGNRSPCAAPHGVYPCRDEDAWVAIAVFDDEEWNAFREATGNLEWTMDNRFDNIILRKEYEDELDSLIGGWTVSFTPAEVMNRLQAAGVPAGIVASNRDLFEDAQLRHRGHFQEVNHPEIGTYHAQMWPGILSKTPWRVKRPAPLLGEHNFSIYKEILGLSDEEIVRLIQSEVIS